MTRAERPAFSSISLFGLTSEFDLGISDSERAERAYGEMSKIIRVRCFFYCRFIAFLVVSWWRDLFGNGQKDKREGREGRPREEGIIHFALLCIFFKAKSPKWSCDLHNSSL